MSKRKFFQAAVNWQEVRKPNSRARPRTPTPENPTPNSTPPPKLPPSPKVVAPAVKPPVDTTIITDYARWTKHAAKIINGPDGTPLAGIRKISLNHAGLSAKMAEYWLLAEAKSYYVRSLSEARSAIKRHRLYKERLLAARLAAKNEKSTKLPPSIPTLTTAPPYAHKRRTVPMIVDEGPVERQPHHFGQLENKEQLERKVKRVETKVDGARQREDKGE